MNFKNIIFLISITSFLFTENNSNDDLDSDFKLLLSNYKKQYHPYYRDYKDLSDVEIVDDLFNKVIDDHSWHLTIGYYYQLLGQHKKAIKIFENLEEKNIHFYYLWYNMACSYSVLGDLKKSNFYLKKHFENELFFLSDDLEDLLWFLHDTDLNNVRDTVEFKEMYSYYFSEIDLKAFSDLIKLTNKEHDLEIRDINSLKILAENYINAADKEKKSNFINYNLLEYAYSSSATIYFELGDSLNANKSLSKLIEMDSDLSLFYRHMLEVYGIKNDFDSFESTIEDLIPIVLKKNKPEELSIVYSLIANIYRDFDYKENDDRNLEKSQEYKIKSYRSDPTQIISKEPYDLEWIYLILVDRKHYEDNYEFFDLIYNANLMFNNDYAFILSLRANEITRTSWGGNSKYTDNEIMKLLDEILLYENLESFKNAEENFEKYYGTVNVGKLFSILLYPLENPDLRKKLIKIALEYTNNHSMNSYYNYFFSYQNKIEEGDYENALKTILKLLDLPQEKIDYDNFYIIIEDYADLLTFLGRYETAKKFIMDYRYYSFEDLTENLVKIYLLEDDSLNARKYELEIVNYIDSTYSEKQDKNKFYKEFFESNLPHFEELIITEMVYDFKDNIVHPVEHLEKGKYRTLKNKFNQSSSIHFLPKNKAYFGIEQLRSLNVEYESIQADSNFNYLFFYTNESFVGIGIQFEKINDYFIVSTIFDNSPAKQVGLRTGDVILKINNLETSKMNIDEFGRNITKNTEIELLIMRNDKDVIRFILKKEKIAIYYAELFDSFNNHWAQPLHDLKNHVNKSLNQIKETNFYIKSENLFSKMLFYIFPNINENEKLVFIPDNILAQLPFEALVDSAGNYLIEDYEISYSFSLTIDSLITNRKYEIKDFNLLAFSNPNFEYNQEKNNLSYLKSDILLRNSLRNYDLKNVYYALGYDNNWVNLPDSEIEVKNLTKIFHSNQTFLNNHANETNLINLSESRRLEDFNIIHFASHANTISEIPQLSSILLSQDNKNDGFLTLDEIRSLNLKADLVTLSACETALGKSYDGEGVEGFIQAFIEAGANGVLSSLWKVNDNATSVFMTSFYTHYAKYRDVPKALALTKREFINGDYGEEYKKPFYWAPFVYYGI